MATAFPPLPARGTPWPPNVVRGAQELNSLCQATQRLLNGHSYGHHQLKDHASRIFGQAYPLIEALLDQGEIPGDWLEEVATLVAGLIDRLIEAYGDVTEEPTGVVQADIVTTERTRGPGRPKKHIDVDFLHEATAPNRKLKKTELARDLNISRGTLDARLKEAGIETGYSEISDEELDNIVLRLRSERPTIGRSYIDGYLRTHGIKVQQKRVQDAITRVDQIGQVLMRNSRRRIERRKYEVARPNALWHIDGHHKLIHWGIVIHGVVDGYSRKVTGLRASTNNKASTVMDMFLDAVLDHGVPSRVRGDRGGENRDVSILMILLRGLYRASFMWGSSVFNTRIERLWVEVGRQFVRAWRAFFRRLGRLHQLDRFDPQHLWLLHGLFLAEINEDCERFKKEWNSHPLSGKGLNISPDDLYLKGMLQHGIYMDECEGMNVDEIHDFYGIENPARQGENDENEEIEDRESEAPVDEEVGDELDYLEDSADEGGDSNGQLDADASFYRSQNVWHCSLTLPTQELAEAIEAEAENIHHEAVSVPVVGYPFQKEESEALLWEHVQELTDSNATPEGYGILPEEWDEGGYPSVEVIPIGFRGKRELIVDLPDHIWRARAERWVRALYLMSSMQYENA